MPNQPIIYNILLRRFQTFALLKVLEICILKTILFIIRKLKLSKTLYTWNDATKLLEKS